MLKAIAVDDEELSLNHLVYLLSKERSISVVKGFRDPKEALESAKQDPPHLAFLDIEMPEMTGLELADHLMGCIPMIDVIFVTAFEQYAIDAFKVRAKGYLLKPFKEEDIHEQVDFIVSQKAMKEEILNTRNVLQINTFGLFQCYLEGLDSQILKFRTAKAEELLAYLIHHQGHFVESDVILDNLWPTMNRSRSQKNFYSTCYYLRMALKEFNLSHLFMRQREGYRIAIEDVFVDFMEFHALCEKSKVSSLFEDELKRAIAIYKGEYFEKKDYLWAYEARVFYEKEWARLQLLLANDYSARNRLVEAIEVLEDLFKKKPFLDAVYKPLLDLYLAIGYTSKAVDFYRGVEGILQKEYGVLPSQEIQDTMKRFL